ncbi:Cenp-O kinetochore centromere component-domain-containing protein [Neurospora hispaniola]|uniref:Cenp-O kinetochore centromere component-domain-containing protein n=1 Tax=Neurospora hispaniola TaxID=588809 RepID=A0AAJ0I4N6_9PEZI|nr:Cenp-O kinetochore centromere component-domain-containing protein [Neurospora hispaniola]
MSSPTPLSTTPSPLDAEIEALKAKVTTLKSHLRIQTSTLIASPSVSSLLSNPPSSSHLKPKGLTPTILKSLRHHASLQKAHNQQSLYRTCATITTFRVQDPDPNAVDGGAVLGLRIEVFARGRFMRPYYVLMNRPWSEGTKNGKGNNSSSKEKEKSRSSRKATTGGGRYANWLRVHRHTVPPCIPISGLAARYLPTPPSSRPDKEEEEEEEEQGGVREQNLVKFARSLRRELVRYHHRLATITDLRRAILAQDQTEQQEEKGPNKIQDVIPADAEAKQITVEWAGGQTGRLVMGDDGEIVQVVALNGGGGAGGGGGQGNGSGRDREVVRELVGSAKRVEDVVRRLGSGTKAHLPLSISNQNSCDHFMHSLQSFSASVSGTSTRTYLGSLLGPARGTSIMPSLGPPHALERHGPVVEGGTALEVQQTSLVDRGLVTDQRSWGLEDVGGLDWCGVV